MITSADVAFSNNCVMKFNWQKVFGLQSLSCSNPGMSPLKNGSEVFCYGTIQYGKIMYANYSFTNKSINMDF